MSRTNRNIEGYFSFILADKEYGLLEEPGALSPFQWFEGEWKGTTNIFLVIEDFGTYKDGILAALKHMGVTCETVCYYTQDQINTSIATIKNGLMKEGFTNVEVYPKKVGMMQPVYGYRKMTFRESFKLKSDIDWYDIITQKVNTRVDMPCYGLYISISW